MIIMKAAHSQFHILYLFFLYSKRQVCPVNKNIFNCSLLFLYFDQLARCQKIVAAEFLLFSL